MYNHGGTVSEGFESIRVETIVFELFRDGWRPMHWVRANKYSFGECVWEHYKRQNPERTECRAAMSLERKWEETRWERVESQDESQNPGWTGYY